MHPQKGSQNVKKAKPSASTPPVLPPPRSDTVTIPELKPPVVAVPKKNSMVSNYIVVLHILTVLYIHRQAHRQLT